MKLWLTFLASMTLALNGCAANPAIRGALAQRQHLPHVVTIPVTAVLHDQNGEYVFVLVQGRAERRNIIMGGSHGDVAEVTSGLREGEQVVTDNVRQIKEGDLVFQ